jgi:hypothetical protein
MDELKTEFWASALIRRAGIAGAFAGVVRKGDTDAGAVMVKVASLDGKARLYAPARNGEGERIWLDLSAGPLGIWSRTSTRISASGPRTIPIFGWWRSRISWGAISCRSRWIPGPAEGAGLPGRGLRRTRAASL